MTSVERQYGSLREKIAAEKQIRLARYDAYEELWTRAMNEGAIAAGNCTPVAMVVQSGNNVVDVVEAGVCGFAYVVFSPGNHSFCKWLSKREHTHKGYYGGLEWACMDYNQSMERKGAHVRAMVRVLSEIPNLSVRSYTRMD